jgi:zinc protease
MLSPLRQVLDNGVVVIVQENHATPAVSMVAAVHEGAYADAPGKDGTASLLALVMDRGTASYSADDLAEALDGRGAALSVSAGRHHLAVAATCLADDCAPVLDIMHEVIAQPRCPEPDVLTRRGELITSIRQDEDDPAAVAVSALMSALYHGHPYARRSSGTTASVDALTRADLLAFHEQAVRPAGLTVVVVGSLAGRAMIEAVTAAFNRGGPRGVSSALAVPDAPAAPDRRTLRITMAEKSQSDIAYGCVGLRRSDPGFLAASVMNNVLGQYAMGGRLGDSIRERQGMAYYVFSALDAGLGPGPFMVRAGVSAANVERTIASIDAELAAVRAAGFTEQEVAESRQYMIGSLPRQLETNAGMAQFLLNAETYGLGLDYDQRLPQLIGAVTREAAVEAARRLLEPDRATIVVAGPEMEPA